MRNKVNFLLMRLVGDRLNNNIKFLVICIFAFGVFAQLYYVHQSDRTLSEPPPLFEIIVRQTRSDLDVQLINDSKLVTANTMWNITSNIGRSYSYTYDSPIVWIGGMPRSGTTLMRVILDAHDQIRCAPETRVIPRLLTMRGSWMESEEAGKLHAAGLYDATIDRAIANFILSILVEHGDPSPVLCNKDPYTLENATYISRLFPNSRFILMIRDARAVVRSIIGQKMKINGCISGNYGECLVSWNRSTTIMMRECEALGPSRCMRVHYELMVLDFQTWVSKITKFLGIEFDQSLLKFHEYVGIPGGVIVSTKERSTDQVNKPLYQEGLTDWIDSFPKELYHNASKFAPLLSRMGYDLHNNPPRYNMINLNFKLGR